MSRKDIDYIFKYIIAIAAALALLLNFETVLRAAGRVASAATPLFVGVLIAYMVDAPAGLFRRKLLSRPAFSRMSERGKLGLSIFAAYMLLLSVVAFLVLVFIPSLMRSLYSFLFDLSGQLEQLLAWVSDWAGGIFDPQRLTDTVNGLLASLRQLLEERSSAISDGAVSAIGSVWEVVYNGFFGLVFSAYILMSRSRVRELGGKLLRVLFHEPMRTAVRRLFVKFHVTFRRYIFGQMTDALILGTLCFVGMLALGLPYASGISVLLAIMSLIPVSGTMIGTILSALILLPGNPFDSLVFVIFVMILQQVENNLIYPKVVGDALGIDGMFVFAGVVMGGGLFGIKGMILGVPATAFLYSLLSDISGIKKRRTQGNIRVDSSRAGE